MRFNDLNMVILQFLYSISLKTSLDYVKVNRAKILKNRETIPGFYNIKKQVVKKQYQMVRSRRFPDWGHKSGPCK